ncbi:MAG: A24 family peptidase C-terminal domain-containing protein [Candidatus Bathyarchaeia archaeon]
MQALLISAKIALSLGVLFYASWSDYKTREVSNRVWAYYAPIALALSLAELLMFDVSMLPYLALSFGLTTGFALLLFYTGGFGGADSKALMCIALALPFSTQALFTPLLGASVSPIAEYIFPLTIFSNSVLFAAASGIYMILRNIIWHKREGKKMFEGSLAKESIGKKILVLITGYRMKVGVLVAKWHVFPMEDVEDATGNRKLVIIPQEDGRDGIVQRLSKAIEEKQIDEYVWATPGLPMLIFVTLGLIVAVFFGDIVWLIVRAILA